MRRIFILKNYRGGSMEKKNSSQKNIFKNAFKTVYRASIYLLIFEIIYKKLLLTLFKPIRTSIISLFVRAKTQEVIFDQGLESFSLTLLGLIFTLAFTLAFVILIYYEFVVILLILKAVKDKDKVKLLKIHKSALAKVEETIKSRSMGLFFYILLLIPILNISIVLSILPTLTVTDLIPRVISRFSGSLILLSIAGLASIYLFTKLFIVLPIIIFRGKSFKKALQISFKTIKGKEFKHVFLILLGVLAFLVISRLPFSILDNANYRQVTSLRRISNILTTIFAFSITPIILSISFETFSSYFKLGYISQEEMNEKTARRQFSKKVEDILERVLAYVDGALVFIGKYRKSFILLILSLIIGANVYAEKGARSLEDRQLVIGHRGGEYGVENTVDTIVFAGSEGSDYVEIDVLLTKDNIPVVIHDNNLKRLAEIDKDISDLTLQEIKDITIESGSKEDEIPTLKELVKEAKGETKLLLEFKIHGKEKESIIDKTIDILKKEGMLEDTVFQTAEDDLIKEFNKKHEDLCMGYIYKSKKKSISIKKALDLPVDFISAKGSFIDKNMIRQVHKHEKPIFAWTIDEIYKAERLLDLGVDGIITNYPLEMIQVIDRYKK